MPESDILEAGGSQESLDPPWCEVERSVCPERKLQAGHPFTEYLGTCREQRAVIGRLPALYDQFAAGPQNSKNL